MRLICPNCAAEYEVPDDVIPSAGRDVQCSNCGHTWFFSPESESEVAAEDEALPDPTPVPEEDPEPLEEDIPPPPQPRQLDPDVASILQEEAAFEARARESERAPPDSQDEPDLTSDSDSDSDSEDESARRSREAQERMARMREPIADAAEEVPNQEEIAAVVAESRREMLPDINEVSSTLRPTDEGPAAPPAMMPEPAERRGGGFRRGFLLMLLIFVVLLLIYVFAPGIVEAVPSVEPLMTSYVAQVDSLRAWLDAQLLGAAGWLDGAVEPGTADAPASE